MTSAFQVKYNIGTFPKRNGKNSIWHPQIVGNMVGGHTEINEGISESQRGGGMENTNC